MTHRKVPNLLSAVSGIMMLLIIRSVLFLDIWPVLLGSVRVYLGKLWFLDQMVWLWEDMNKEEEISLRSQRFSTAISTSSALRVFLPAWVASLSASFVSFAM